MLKPLSIIVSASTIKNGAWPMEAAPPEAEPREKPVILHLCSLFRLLWV